jgi:alkylation response protein AidB-like acyl-CoA dehydrogenase
VESAQSLSRAATEDAPALRLRAAAVKVYCSEALMRTAGEMIQLHGAIGITWEHPAHRYLKRAHGAMYLFGTPAQHAATIAASLIDQLPAPGGVTPARGWTAGLVRPDK